MKIWEEGYKNQSKTSVFCQEELRRLLNIFRRETDKLRIEQVSSKITSLVFVFQGNITWEALFLLCARRCQQPFWGMWWLLSNNAVSQPPAKGTLVDWQLRTGSMQGSVWTPTSSVSWSSFYQNEKLWIIALFIAVWALSCSEWFFVLTWCAKPDVTITWVPARAVLKHNVWKLYGSIKLGHDQYLEWLWIYVVFCLTFTVVKWAVWWIISRDDAKLRFHVAV